MKKLFILAVIAASLTGMADVASNCITMKFTTPYLTSTDMEPSDDVQTALKMTTNGCFQVWSRGIPVSDNRWTMGTPHWIELKSDLNLVYGREYTFDITINYDTDLVSISIADYLDEKSYQCYTTDHFKMKEFPLAKSADSLHSISFTEDARVSNLVISKYP